MKYSGILIIVLLLLGCDKPYSDHPVFGTWRRCEHSGGYTEIKYTKDYILVMHKRSDDIEIFDISLFEDKFTISQFEGGIYPMGNNDTFAVHHVSADSIWIRCESRESIFAGKLFRYQRTNIEIENIDSNNFESWHQRTIEAFKVRASLIDCPDLRTEEVKIIYELEPIEIEDDSIPITKK